MLDFLTQFLPWLGWTAAVLTWVIGLIRWFKTHPFPMPPGKGFGLSIFEVFNHDLIRAEKVDEFLALVKSLQIPGKRKKEVIVEFCKITGVPLTIERIESGGGRG